MLAARDAVQAGRSSRLAGRKHAGVSSEVSWLLLLLVASYGERPSSCSGERLPRRSPCRGDWQDARCRAWQRGKGAVVDPAEREGLDEYVVTVACH